MNKSAINLSPLGKKTAGVTTYDNKLLYPIARSENSIYGVDIWNIYELSWLNLKGKPEIAMLELIVPASSPNIVESKSLKLYLTSFSDTKFASIKKVVATIKKDLTAVIGTDIMLNIVSKFITKDFSGVCLDDYDITCDIYNVHPKFLTTEKKLITETLYSHLLKSNCPVTGQPDWGSIQISYTGPKINHAGLLKYIISFRHQQEFHEQCIERMFTDIMRHCQPQKLTVYGRYTRRGGIDINPYRSTTKGLPGNQRLPRQ